MVTPHLLEPGSIPDEADPPTHAPAQVFLHVGAPKTGTSYLQSVLLRNRAELERQGILVPSGSWVTGQVWPVVDLMARDPDDERVAEARGAWKRFVSEVGAWRGRGVVLSMEFLAKAHPDQVQTVAEDLAGTEVHVVVTARDLGRQLPAAWQESLQNGRHWRWERYLDACAAEEESKPRRHFRRSQDLVRMVTTWGEHVPPERIHLVTLPRGGPSGTLVDRFCTVLDVDPGVLDLEVSRANPSLGAASAEVMRLVNKEYSDLDRATALALKHILAKRILTSREGEPRVTIPKRHRRWVVETSKAMVAELRQLDLHVVGDLDDLVVRAEDLPTDRRPDDKEVLAAAVHGLVGLTDEVAAARRLARPEPDPGIGDGAGSVGEGHR